MTMLVAGTDGLSFSWFELGICHWQSIQSEKEMLTKFVCSQHSRFPHLRRWEPFPDRSELRAAEGIGSTDPT